MKPTKPTCIGPSTSEKGKKCLHYAEHAKDPNEPKFCGVHYKRCSELHTTYKTSCNYAYNTGVCSNFDIDEMSLEELEEYVKDLESKYGANIACRDDRNKFKTICVYPDCEDESYKKHEWYYSKFPEISKDCENILTRVKSKIIKKRKQLEAIDKEIERGIKIQIEREEKREFKGPTRQTPKKQRKKKRQEINEEEILTVAAKQAEKEKINVIKQIINIVKNDPGPDYSKLTYYMEPLLQSELFLSIFHSMGPTREMVSKMYNFIGEDEPITENQIIEVLNVLSSIELTNALTVIKETGVLKCSFEGDMFIRGMARGQFSSSRDLYIRSLLLDKKQDNSNNKNKLITEIMSIFEKIYQKNDSNKVATILFDLVNFIDYPLFDIIEQSKNMDEWEISINEMEKIISRYFNIPELEFIKDVLENQKYGIRY